MIKIEDLEETYKLCMGAGKIKEKQFDIELIRSIKTVSEKCLAFIKDRSKDIPQDSSDWTFVFRDYYESLRGLIEAYLLFDGIRADNHQCKNAYLCFQHKQLNLDWDFLEMIRLRRNAINYRGQLLRYRDWKALEFNFELHIMALKKEIEKKLNDV